MASRSVLPRSALALAACAALCAAARAQEQTVTISTRGALPAAVTGFGDVPLARSPLQASVFSAQALTDTGVLSLAGLTRLDASVSDAYNAEGYWSYLTVRGFVLDNRANYLRDGLPINAETAIGLDNKERIEVLKGTSGIQAGTSTPGGLVNLVVKRPDGDIRSASLEWRERGTVIGRVDLGGRFGGEGQFGLRLNAAYADIQPQTHSADGSRNLLALAGDWQLSPDSLLQAEFETSRQRQPSVPGFSLLGNAVPDAGRIDPRTNLNNQPWSQPVVLSGNTGSLRWQQRLAGDWRFVAHGMVQRLKSDDRIAFPFGCSAEGNYDRFCSDGSFDLYDFRSDGERRDASALDLQFSGSAQTGAFSHRLTVGLLASRFKARFNPQIYNFAGTGRIDGSAVTPPATDPTSPNTNRDEDSTAAYLRDVVTLAPGWELWGGLRTTRLQRSGAATPGGVPIDYSQTFTTPFFALSHALDEATLVYASWGQGVETEVAPNLPIYANAGQPLPALKSRQFEAGIKHSGAQLDWSLTGFDILRPLAQDLNCDTGPCVRAIDGDAHHRGLEASLGWRSGAWGLLGSTMLLDARRQGASDAAANGLRPTNVPEATLKLRGSYQVAAVPGLSLNAGLVHEGGRMVLPDNSISVPGWTALDLGLRYAAGASMVWRLALDNATDARAWRESPYQFGHAYLFPLPPRALRASVTASF